MKVIARVFWRFFKKYPRRVLGVFLLLIFGVSLPVFGVRSARFICKTLFSCPVVDITCTDCYSPLVKKKLVSFVRAHMSNVNYLFFDAQNFYSSLKDQFDCVTKVTISKRLPLGFCVKINGVRPVMLLNNDYVLAADRGVYSRQNFISWHGLEQLPNVIVPNLYAGMKVTPWAYDALQKLATDYSKDYVCLYKNPSYIRLEPRLSQRYVAVVLRDVMLENNGALRRLNELVDDALHRGFCSQNMLEKKRRSVELDMRFERRIIMKFIDHGKRGRGL